MIVEIDAAGRRHRVAIEPDRGRDGRYVVTIDDAPVEVDAVRTPTGYSLIVEGRVLEVALVESGTRGEFLVHLPSTAVPVSIDAGRRRRAGAAGQADGEQRIAAPMPGRIVRVLVAEGDEVEMRQPLVVVEAMKMENELRAPKAGRVKEVAVEAGASVEAGRLLVVIE